MSVLKFVELLYWEQEEKMLFSVGMLANILNISQYVSQQSSAML